MRSYFTNEFNSISYYFHLVVTSKTSFHKFYFIGKVSVETIRTMIKYPEFRMFINLRKTLNIRDTKGVMSYGSIYHGECFASS